MDTRFKSQKKNSGFSIVEIMVAMVVSLLGILVITQVFALSEGHKRTATSGTDAQENGINALFNIEREARMAGYGFMQAGVLGCNITYSNPSGKSALPNTMPNRLIPITVIDGGADGSSDTIRILYSTSDSRAIPPRLTQSAGANSFTVDSIVGMDINDFLIAFESDARPCAITRISAAPTFNAATQTGTIPFSASNWNGTNMPSPAYAANTMLFNMGKIADRTFLVNGENGLNMFDVETQRSISIASNIVSVQAQYGISTAPDVQNISGWTSAVGEWAPATLDYAHIARIKAIRLLVIARSELPEKLNDQTKLCDTTLNAPQDWAGTAIKLPDGAATNNKWQCYRYRVYQTTVPLRNILWATL